MQSKGSRVNFAEKAKKSDPNEIINEEASAQVNDFEGIIDSGATQHMTFDNDSSDYIEL